MGNQIFSDRIVFVPLIGKIDCTDYTLAKHARGVLMVHGEDESPRRFIHMLNEDDGVYNASGGDTWNDCEWSSPKLETQTVGVNVTGRTFALFLSNLGTYNYSHPQFAEKGQNLEITGWGMWIVPRTTLRPDGN